MKTAWAATIALVLASCEASSGIVTGDASIMHLDAAASVDPDSDPDANDSGVDSVLPRECVDLQNDVQTAVERVRYINGWRSVAVATSTTSCGVQSAVARATDDPVDELRGWRIGSVTKTFIAAMILKLASEGLVSLDAPISDFVPEVHNGTATIRQVLEHTSGVFDYLYTDAATEHLTNQPLTPLVPSDLIAMANTHSPSFAPGAAYEYSNTNYVLAGMVVESVTEAPVHLTLREHLLEPLDLGHTYLDGAETATVALEPSYVAGYDVRGVYDMSIAWASGAMVASPEDLVRWVRALYAGDALTANERAAMLDASPQSGGQYGLGAAVLPATITLGAGAAFGHAGSVWGYKTQAFYFAGIETAYVVFVGEEEGVPNDVTLEVLPLLVAHHRDWSY